MPAQLVEQDLLQDTTHSSYFRAALDAGSEIDAQPSGAWGGRVVTPWASVVGAVSLRAKRHLTGRFRDRAMKFNTAVVHGGDTKFPSTAPRIGSASSSIQLSAGSIIIIIIITHASDLEVTHSHPASSDIFQNPGTTRRYGTILRRFVPRACHQNLYSYFTGEATPPRASASRPEARNLGISGRTRSSEMGLVEDDEERQLYIYIKRGCPSKSPGQ